MTLGRAMKLVITIVSILHLFSLTEVEAVAPILRGMKPFWIKSNRLGIETKSRDQRWAEEAFNYLKSVDCEHVTFTDLKECEHISKLPNSAITVYFAPPSPYGRYVTTIPDEYLSRGESHDAVLVLDPYPKASFGHVVVVFFIDKGVSRSECRLKDGIDFDSGECMHLAQRRRCRNVTEKKFRLRNFAKRCEVSFLPTVTLETEFNGERKNYLSCRSDLSSFHGCRHLRSRHETSELLCDPLRENAHACATTHDTIRTSCRTYEICDQAVLLSGGWNSEYNEKMHKNNILDMYIMLRRNGFKRRNIKIFYSNGQKNFHVPDELDHTAYPAAMKLAFRYHLQRMCSTPHCVNSLVLYLNNPATHDSSMLLWDIDKDGLASEDEMYTVVELLHDLAHCAATQVQIIADQSYSGEIAHAVKMSAAHTNVLVVTSGKGYEYSYANEFSKFWAHQNDTRACVSDIFKEISESIQHSTPVMANAGRVKTTFSGAPCDVKPPFSNRELRRDYFGCQNVPTAIWLSHMLNDDSL